jgi:hypothetical protein
VVNVASSVDAYMQTGMETGQYLFAAEIDSRENLDLARIGASFSRREII